MPIKATCVAALAIALTSACSTTAPDTPAASAPAAAMLPPIAGVYGGSYTCIDGEHGFYLNLTKATSNAGGGYDVAGVLGLFPTVTGQGGPSGMASGSFKVTGTIAANGAIAMTAGDWLIQPPGYGAANLEGTITKTDSAGYVLRGKPVVPGRPDVCSDLLATQFLP